MIYTQEARAAVHRIAAPPGFVMDIVEFDGFLLLRFYSGQWDMYSEHQRALAANYLQAVKDRLAEFGILSTLDPVLGAPPR